MALAFVIVKALVPYVGSRQHGSIGTSSLRSSGDPCRCRVTNKCERVGQPAVCCEPFHEVQRSLFGCWSRSSVGRRHRQVRVDHVLPYWRPRRHGFRESMEVDGFGSGKVSDRMAQGSRQKDHHLSVSAVSSGVSGCPGSGIETSGCSGTSATVFLVLTFEMVVEAISSSSLT